MAEIKRLPKKEQWIPFAAITISAEEWDALRNALNEWQKTKTYNGSILSIKHQDLTERILESLRGTS